MNRKKTWLIIIGFVVLIAGASVLYQYLGDEVESAPFGKIESTSASQEDEHSTEEQTDTQTNPAPDFTVVDENGEEYQLSDFKGKPVVLNFWASWCGPCKSEMPDFEKAYQKYKDEISFLMVNLTDGSRETVEKASAHVKEQGYSFPVYYDTMSEAAMTYGVYSIPTSYFINKEGNIIAHAQGAIDKENLEKGISMIYTNVIQ